MEHNNSCDKLKIPELNEEDMSVVLKENANKGYNKKSPKGLLICNGYIFYNNLTLSLLSQYL